MDYVIYCLGILIDGVKDHVICGMLLCLRKLIPLVTMEIDDNFLLPKIYCLLLRCCLHSNHNVVTSALEALSVLLWKPVTSLIIWLTTVLDHMTPLYPISRDDSNNEDDTNASKPLFSDGNLVSSSPSGSDIALSSAHSSHSDILVSDFPSPLSPSSSDIPLQPSLSNSDMPLHSSSNDDIPLQPSPSNSDVLLSPSEKSPSPFLNDDTSPAADDSHDTSLLVPCDDHFVVSLSTTDASVSVSLASACPTSATPVLSCDLPNVDVTALQLPGATTPIQTLLQLLGTQLLTDHVRVSVKAVAIQCIVAIAMWSPQQLLVTVEAEKRPKLIELLLPYMECDDPKLCGNCCQVLSHYIKGLLLWDTSDHVMSVSSAVDKMVKSLTDNSAIALHAIIPSLPVR